MRPVATIFIYLASVLASTPLAIQSKTPDAPTCNCCCKGVKPCHCGCVPVEKDKPSQPSKQPDNKHPACFCNGQQVPMLPLDTSPRLEPQKYVETADFADLHFGACASFSNSLGCCNCGPPPDQPILESIILLI